MKLKLLLLAVIVIALIAFNAFFPFRDYLEDAVDWFRDQGPFGAVLYVAIFVACAVFFLPISGMILIAGTLYGFWAGYAIAAFSGLASIAVTHVLGKKLMRKRVEALRHQNPRFESIFEAVSKQGTILVLLIRLNPFLPFSLLNYLFTVPKLDFRKYLLSSFLGITPDIMFYLYVGKLGRGFLEDGTGLSVRNYVVLGLALTTTGVAAFIINRIIRKAALPSGPMAGESMMTARSGT